MDMEPVESNLDEDAWLNTISVGSTSKGRKAKEHFNFDVFSVPFEKMFPGTVTVDTQSVNMNIKVEECEQTAVMEVVMGTKFTCRVCGCIFSALREQYDHFKSPLHVVNLKRSLVGLESVNHEDDIDSDEEENLENDDEVVIDEPTDIFDLMKYNKDGKLSSESTLFKEGWVRKYNHKANGSVVAFRKLSSNWEFSISSAIFSLSLTHSDPSSSSAAESHSEGANPWVTLKNTLQIFHQGEKLHSCVLILQSGMFSGGVFEGNKCILHKVFRRYTVRAKAGGGQSSFDSNGRKAKSAGATLRRYGEQALKEDVHSLLMSWLPYLQSSVVILTAIPNTMKHYIFSDTLQQSGFHRDDARIKTIPFMIKKPTFEEIKIAHQKCMLIEFSLIKELDSALKEESGLDTVMEELVVVPPPVSATTIARTKAEVVASSDVEELSPLEVVVPEEVCGLLRKLVTDLGSGHGEHFSQLMTAIGVAAAAAAASTDNSGAVESISQHQYQSLWLSTPHSLEQLETPLHVAAEGGCSREVLTLLQAGASPVVTDIRSRYPYFLAKDKDTRDAFRRFRGEHEEGLEQEQERGKQGEGEGKGYSWDWNLCGIPSGITKEMIKDKKEKEREKKKKAKQRKQNAKQEKAEQDSLDILAKEKEAADRKELEVRNYKLVGECGFCQKSLMGIVPLDIFDRRCCSSGCVVMMRRRLTAEAAEKRQKNLK